MKVYLIEQVIGSYPFINEVHSTYRGASQFLIDEGFTPCVENIFGEYHLSFYVDDPLWYDTEAFIVERAVIEG